MADRSVHYEAALEAYLREKGIPCVVVDEARRAVFAQARLKSFDFVVYSRRGVNLLVDVKGRQLRGAGTGGAFQTWTTQRDVEDLMQWQQVFGDGFKALLVFIYWIEPPLVTQPGNFPYRDRWYWALGVELAEYRQFMRRRSPKWETVSLPAADFRSLARPLDEWL
jgi:hypothetical protein